MRIDPGKTYVDHFNARRRVIAIAHGIVFYQLPLSRREESCVLEDFEAWATGEYAEMSPA